MIPHAPQIERQVLAAIIRKGALFDLATAGNITADSFHVPENRHIFEAMATLSQRGTAIDLVALDTLLPDLIEILMKLESGTIATDVNFPDWLQSLRNHEAARLLRAGAVQIAEMLAAPAPDTAAAIAELTAAEERARRMLAGTRAPELPEIAEELRRNMIQAPPPVIPFFSPGSEGASKVQFHPGEMMVIGARTGLGKTAFACGAALEQLRSGFTVLYFCTESTGADILARMAAQISGVSHYEPQKRYRDPDKVKRFSRAVDRLQGEYARRLYIHGCENGLITPDTIRGRCREIQLETGRLDVVYVDFLQGVKAPAHMERRTSLERTNYNVEQLHALLSEYHAAGVLLAQFNRSSQSGGAGGLPDITWLKDSSLIEQLAHTVAFLHREETNVPNAPTLFYSRKTRNQAPFTTGFSLDWNGTGYTSAPAYDSSGIPQYSPGAEHD